MFFPKESYILFISLHEATHKCNVRTDQIENEERERKRDRKTERMKKRGGFDVTF